MIYRTLGPDFDDRVLPSVGNVVLKEVIAQYNAKDLLSKRGQISEQINAAIVERAAKFDLVIDEVSITHLSILEIEPDAGADVQ